MLSFFKKKTTVTSVKEIDPSNLDSDAMVLVINTCNELIKANPNDADLGKSIRKVFNDLHKAP